MKLSNALDLLSVIITELLPNLVEIWVCNVWLLQLDWEKLKGSRDLPLFLEFSESYTLPDLNVCWELRKLVKTHVSVADILNFWLIRTLPSKADRSSKNGPPKNALLFRHIDSIFGFYWIGGSRFNSLEWRQIATGQI